MKNRRTLTTATTITILVMLAAGNGGALASPTSQPKFADPAFQRTWERTDALVASGKVKRSFYWGPAPNTGALQEEYAEGPGGKHLVQYFDKSRMEINDPKADKNNPFYVTNGLLTVELISGSMQVGNSKFVQRWHAEIPLASDTDDQEAPTYATFRSLYKYTTNDTTGLVLTTSIDRYGTQRDVPRFASYDVKNVYFEKATERNIPDVFLRFLDSTGPVLVDGKQQTARLSDPYFYATGYPITNAYWATVKIAGKPNTDVLIQAYERRVLTYVPSAPEGFKVQMGNIGQHYYDWRYKDVGKPGPISCGELAPAGFGKLWSQDVVVQRRLLCPEYWEQANVQIEHFQFGDVVYVQLINVPPRTSALTTAAYVFASDGTVKSYFPDRRLGLTGPKEDPPSGLLKPSGEPGRLWRESAEARKLLGWATTPVKDIAEEERQFFRFGLMVGDGDKIYMFYNEEYAFWAYPAYWVIYANPIPFPARQPIDGRSCKEPPPRSNLWFENLLVQNRLGCPDSTPQVSMAFQPFQNGAMIYLEIQGPVPPGLPSNKLIYVLSYPGKVDIFPDTYVAGSPEPSPPPLTPGQFIPALGFGKVWRENDLHPTLGFATAPERSITPQERQLFQKGFIITDGTRTYVLYNKAAAGYANSRAWYLYLTTP